MFRECIEGKRSVKIYDLMPTCSGSGNSSTTTASSLAFKYLLPRFESTNHEWHAEQDKKKHMGFHLWMDWLWLSVGAIHKFIKTWAQPFVCSFFFVVQIFLSFIIIFNLLIAICLAFGFSRAPPQTESIGRICAAQFNVRERQFLWMKNCGRTKNEIGLAKNETILTANECMCMLHREVFEQDNMVLSLTFSK